MTTLAHNTGPRRWATTTRRRAAGDLAVALVAVLVMAVMTRWLFEVSHTYVAKSIGLYVGLAALILRSGSDEFTGPGVGPANRVTLGRSTLVLPISALALEPPSLPDDVQWWIIAVSTVAMICDGIDGAVARRTGTNTVFGARFDMELDSFLALALSTLVWRSGKVGLWIVLIGAFRYLFVVAGWLWPALTVKLPPSQRRKTVCVVNSTVLLICLAPIISSSVASAAAAAALLLLTWSFAVDIRWLAIRAPLSRRTAVE